MAVEVVYYIFGVGISLGFRDMGSTISCSFVLRHIKNIKSNFRCQEHCMGSKECKLIKSEELIGCPVSNAKWNASDKLNQQCM